MVPTTVKLDMNTKTQLLQMGYKIGPLCNKFLKGLLKTVDDDSINLAAINEEISEIEKKEEELIERKTQLLAIKIEHEKKAQAARKAKEDQAEAEAKSILRSGIVGEL